MSTPIAQGRAPGGMWRISDGLLGRPFRQIWEALPKCRPDSGMG